MIEFLYISYGETHVGMTLFCKEHLFPEGLTLSQHLRQVSNPQPRHLRSNLYLSSLSTKNTTQCGEKTRLELNRGQIQPILQLICCRLRNLWHGFFLNFWIARKIWVTPLKTGLFRWKQGVIRGFELMISYDIEWSKRYQEYQWYSISSWIATSLVETAYNSFLIQCMKVVTLLVRWETCNLSMQPLFFEIGLTEWCGTWTYWSPPWKYQTQKTWTLEKMICPHLIGGSPNNLNNLTIWEQNIRQTPRFSGQKVCGLQTCSTTWRLINRVCHATFFLDLFRSTVGKC